MHSCHHEMISNAYYLLISSMYVGAIIDLAVLDLENVELTDLHRYCRYHAVMLPIMHVFIMHVFIPNRGDAVPDWCLLCTSSPNRETYTPVDRLHRSHIHHAAQRI